MEVLGLGDMGTPSQIDDEKEILEECQDALGYTFEKPELLRAALTHSSSAYSRAASNERMEFLGDSILGLVGCELLYERFPDHQEGELTKLKSVIVSRKTCAEFSRRLGVEDFLFLGKGMPARSEIPMNVLADTFEALVAAIYLDGGFDEAKDFLLEFLVPVLDEIAQLATGSNAKSQLQQLAQKEYGGTPRYLVLDEQGPDHDKCFKIAADVEGLRFPAAWGRNKKEAEQKAALNALAEIQKQPIPYPS
ncbi:MAG: ribonuclease III [Fimbriiglobus sp.]